MHAVLSERELIKLLVEGVGAKEMAARLGLSEEQAREIVVRLLRELGERSRR